MSIQVHVVRFKFVLSAISDRVDRSQMGMDLLQRHSPGQTLHTGGGRGPMKKQNNPLSSGQLGVISLVVLPSDALSSLCRNCLLSLPKKIKESSLSNPWAGLQVQGAGPKQNT